MFMKQDQKKETAPTQKESSVSKKSKELYWIFGIMFAVIIIFLVASAYFKSSSNFEYEGLSFTKENFGEIPLYRYSYTTDSMIKSVTGQIVSSGSTKPVAVLLRNDPRENNVPVTGKIEYLPREKFVYVSLGSGLFCEYSTVALANLQIFFSQNGFTVRPATQNETESNETNLQYVNCENRPDNMVLMLQGGEESSIVRNNNCYIITAADCDVLSATEKFIIQSIIDAKEPAD